MSISAKRMLDQARSWLGYGEANGRWREILKVYNSHRPLARGYAIKESDEWCATFVSACAIKLGVPELFGTEVGVERFIQDHFKPRGIWIEDGTIIPKPGDIVTFNWQDSTHPNDGWADHIGFVEEVNGRTLTFIEGNYKKAVTRRTVNAGWGYIRGYARPKYTESSVNPPAANKSVDTLAHEVIRGVWGVGDERKRSLAQAGYDYNAVQERVNAILNNRVLKNIDVVAAEVLDGKWGNGNGRVEALTRAGYNAATVQAKVNEILSGRRKSITTVAHEVIQGRWGNGAHRRRKLENAGYNYNDVQREVNRILG